MKSKCNIETIESTTLEVHQSSKINEEFDNDEIKLLDCAESNTLSESVIDSWVKLDTNKSSTTPIKSEQTIKIFQEITRPQKVLPIISYLIIFSSYIINYYYYLFF